MSHKQLNFRVKAIRVCPLPAHNTYIVSNIDHRDYQRTVPPNTSILRQFPAALDGIVRLADISSSPSDSDDDENSAAFLVPSWTTTVYSTHNMRHKQTWLDKF
jgi:hypothetical protein